MKTEITLFDKNLAQETASPASIAETRNCAIMDSGKSPSKHEVVRPEIKLVCTCGEYNKHHAEQKFKDFILDMNLFDLNVFRAGMILSELQEEIRSLIESERWYSEQ